MQKIGDMTVFCLFKAKYQPDFRTEITCFAACLEVETNVIPDYSGEIRFLKVSCKGKLMEKIGAIPTENEKALQEASPALAQAWRSFQIVISIMAFQLLSLNRERWLKFII